MTVGWWLGGDPSLCFSHDYGRTWTERIPLAKSPDGKNFCSEGSLLVDYDDLGRVKLIGWTDQTFPDNVNLEMAIGGCVRWSRDGGHTWKTATGPRRGNGKTATTTEFMNLDLVKGPWSVRPTVGSSRLYVPTCEQKF